MAFFGLFKSKEERGFDNSMQQMMGRIFPGGERDILRDCERINYLTHEKIQPEKLRGFISGCKVRSLLNKGESEEVLINSILARSEGRITEREAFDVFVYIEGEANYYDNISSFMKQSGGTVPDASDSLFGDTPWTYKAGVYTDEIPGGYGEYGLEVSNPIPTISAKYSVRYLSKLRFGGMPVVANRLGSTSTEVIKGSIDIYQLEAVGKPVGKVYICPYHKCNSKKAPRGFTLV